MENHEILYSQTNWTKQRQLNIGRWDQAGRLKIRVSISYRIIPGSNLPVNPDHIILDGNSKHVEQAWRKIGLFGEKSDLWLVSIKSNASHKSNNLDCSLRVPSYPPILIFIILTSRRTTEYLISKMIFLSYFLFLIQSEKLDFFYVR